MAITNVANTNLTDVIRIALVILGDNAVLVKATAKKKTKVEWFKGGTKGVNIPSKYPTSHTESFESGEKILLIQRIDDFYYYNDDENQWYMLHGKQVLVNFTIEKSIRADVTKVREKVKMSVESLLEEAKKLASSLDSASSNSVGVQAWKSSGNEVMMAVAAVERRTTPLDVLKKYSSKINSKLNDIQTYFNKLGGVNVNIKFITADTFKAYEEDNEYSEYEIEISRNVVLTLK